MQIGYRQLCLGAGAAHLDDGMADRGGAAFQAADVVRAQRVRNRSLDRASSPTSSTNRGLSMSSPMDFLKAAMRILQWSVIQSCWNACSSGSSSSDRRRLHPG